MLNDLQLKAIECLALGKTKTKTTQVIKVSRQTLDNWLRTDEFRKSLALATDTFANEVSKARTREYRSIAKSISDQINLKIDADGLANYSIEELIKMMGNLSNSMKTELTTDRPQLASLMNIQNNIQIGDGARAGLENKEFMAKLGEAFMLVDPRQLQEINESRIKLEKENK